jgi:uncharacterized protein (TIGR03437 family)
MPSRRGVFVCAALALSAAQGFSQGTTTLGFKTTTGYDLTNIGIDASTATADLDFKFPARNSGDLLEATVHVVAPANITASPGGKTTPFNYSVGVTSGKNTYPASFLAPGATPAWSMTTTVAVPGHDATYCQKKDYGNAASTPFNFSGTTVACSVDAIATDSSGSLSGTNTVTTTIKFSGPVADYEFYVRTFFTTGAATSGTADLAIVRVALVQVVHNSIEVPLIANRRTVARVFIKSMGATAQPVNNVTAVLHSPFPPDPYALRFTGPITAQTYNGPIPPNDPFDFTQPSIDFQLPDDWVAKDGAFDLTAEIVPPAGFTDSNLANNTFKQYVVLHKQPHDPLSLSPEGQFRVGYITLDHFPPGAAFVNKVRPGLNTTGTFMRKMFPLADKGLQFQRACTIKNPYTGPLASFEDGDALVARLRMRVFDIMTAAKTTFDQLVVFLPYETTNPLWGNSDPLWNGGFGDVVTVQQGDTAGAFQSNEDQTVAHEIGHNLGLRHVVFAAGNARGCVTAADGSSMAKDDCGTAKEPNTSQFWPYPDPTIQYPGYDLERLVPTQVPATRFDFMSYCQDATASNIWISPAYFQKLFDNNLAASLAACPPVKKPFPFEPSAAADPTRPARAISAAPRDYLLVSGSASADGLTGQLSPIFRLTTQRVPPASDPAGNYCLRFFGSAGALGDYCFVLSFVNGEGQQLTRQFFSFVVTAPSGATRIGLMRGGQQLASISGGAQPPSVSITSPRSGERWNSAQTVTWTGTSSAALTYLVDYSYDGGATWVPLTLDTIATSVSVSPGDFLGPEIYIRVQASDGFNTATAQVGPIQVSQTPQIAATPISLDFQNGLPGTSVDRALVLNNPGSGPLEVTSVTFSGASFTLTYPALPLRIFAGDSVTLGVRFTPPGIGPRVGTMSIANNATTAPLQIPLQGNGSLTDGGTGGGGTTGSAGGCAATAGAAAGTVVGTGSGVGAYTLSRIEVTRTYNPATIQGSVSPGKQTYPASQTSFQVGWNYRWPDANTGPNFNNFIETVNLTSVPQTVAPPANVPISVNVTGAWNSSGFGVDRDHTYSIDGAAGQKSDATCCNPNSTVSKNFSSSGNNPAPADLRGEIRVTITGNLNFGPDQGAGSMQIDLVYTLGGASCTSFSISPPAQFPGAGGGSFSVPVTASSGCAWSSTVLSGAAWLSVAGSGTGSGSASVTVSANNTGSYRGGVVGIAGQLLSVSQPPSSAAGTYTLTRIDVTRTYTAGIASDNPCPATIPPIGRGCANVNPIQPGKQTFSGGQVVLAYQTGWDFFWGAADASSPAANRNRLMSVLNLDSVPAAVTPGATVNGSADMFGDWNSSGYGVNRYHTLSVSGLVGTGKAQTATDNPNGLGTLAFNPTAGTGTTVPSPDSNGEIRLVINGDASFASAGDGATRVELVYTAGSFSGTCGVPSTGGGTGGGGGSTTPFSGSLNQPGQVIGTTGGTLTIVVTGTGSWTATPVESWIQIVSGTSGNGNATVTFTVPANAGPPRSGTIRIGDLIHVVYQNGTPTGTTAGCNYLIQSSTVQSVPVSGTTSGLVQVITAQNCGWTAITAASWIALLSGTTSTGNGAVAFTVPQNNTGYARSGAIVIAGQNVVINQAGGAVPGTPAVSAGGVVNTASYAPGGPPNGSLAQGSYFSIYGSDLGPDQPIKAEAYPLPSELGGVTLQISQGSNQYNAYLVFVSKGQINAILPSNVPVGSARLVVKYDNKTSQPADIVVAKTSLGIFFQRVAGKDLAIAQNYKSATDYPLNLPGVPAKPGQYVILWATGLGPINGADNVAPSTVNAVGDMNSVPVTITVGGVTAQKTYAGRQAQTSAVDNVYFIVPSGVPYGCQVPVVVTAGGTAANTTMIAVTADGSPCQ